jgi:hypothetical protein
MGFVFNKRKMGFWVCGCSVWMKNGELLARNVDEIETKHFGFVAPCVDEKPSLAPWVSGF